MRQRLWFKSKILKQTKNYIKQMIEKQMSRNAKADSDSESDGNGPDWTQGLNSVQQMFIAQEFKKNDSYDSDNAVTHIDPDDSILSRRNARKWKSS